MEMNYKIWFDTENIYLQNNNGEIGYLSLEDYKPLKVYMQKIVGKKVL